MGRSGGTRNIEQPDPFADEVARWIFRHRYLIDALVGLRRLGPEAEDAVDAVPEVRRVKQFRLGWELCVAFAEGDGGNPYLGASRRVSRLATNERVMRRRSAAEVLASE